MNPNDHNFPPRFGDQFTAGKERQRLDEIAATMAPGEMQVAPGSTITLPDGRMKRSGEPITIEDLGGPLRGRQRLDDLILDWRVIVRR